MYGQSVAAAVVFCSSARLASSAMDESNKRAPCRGLSILGVADVKRILERSIWLRPGVVAALLAVAVMLAVGYGQAKFL